jgi:hypothetical protein
MFQRALCRQLSSACSDRFRDTPDAPINKGRAAVERELGRLKNECALAPLRVQALDRVRPHAHPTILAKLASALARGRIACDGRRVQAARRARGQVESTMPKRGVRKREVHSQLWSASTNGDGS